MNSSFGFSIRPFIETQYLQCKRKGLYFVVIGIETGNEKIKKKKKKEEENLSISSTKGIGP